jgi:hypothetical protein
MSCERDPEMADGVGCINPEILKMGTELGELWANERIKKLVLIDAARVEPEVERWRRIWTRHCGCDEDDPETEAVIAIAKTVFKSRMTRLLRAAMQGDLLLPASRLH